MTTRWAVAAAFGLFIGGALSTRPVAGVAAAPPPALTTLVPGAPANISHDVNVNVVFVGYEAGSGPRDVDVAAIRAPLPATSQPIETLTRRRIGLTYRYAYNFVFADASFEDAFFGYLSSIAIPMPLTVYQDLYNTNQGRTLDVTSNHWIDAPSVEKWLSLHPPAGVDTTKYTIFFVNWYGRPDFKFHGYTKTDEPDSDTGVNFGERFMSRKMIAWGGTTADDFEGGLGSTHRIWFHDLSAGPEAWTENYELNIADLDGNGTLDYRMPPVWEYGNTSPALYRPFDDLSGDLAKLIRYVAVNLLFTTSALYSPAISPPFMPSRIQLDMNLYQGDPAVDGTRFLNASKALRRLRPLQPLNAFSAEVRDQPLDGRTLGVYECFRTAFFGPPPFGDSCFGNRFSGLAFFDLLVYFRDHLNQFIDGDEDYEVPMFMFNTTGDLSVLPTTGFTQGFLVFGFLDEFGRDVFGFTDTAVHEVGHHLGMHHPHDGYDAEQNFEYFSSDAYYFAWAGDESNSVMSYLSLTADFGQFDRDNMDRFLTASYIRHANRMLLFILRSPRASEVSTLLVSADASARAAIDAIAAMDYRGAAAAAKDAHGKVVSAAAAINVYLEPENYTAEYRSPVLRSVDMVDFRRALW